MEHVALQGGVSSVGGGQTQIDGSRVESVEQLERLSTRGGRLVPAVD